MEASEERVDLSTKFTVIKLDSPDHIAKLVKYL
jgi:hypothetical protein